MAPYQLREIITPSELQTAADFCLQHPSLLPIGYSVKYQLEGRFPEATIRVFTNVGEPVCWFGFRSNIFERKKMIFLEAEPAAAFRKDDFLSLFKEFLTETQAFDPQQQLPLTIASSLPDMDALLRKCYKELQVEKRFEVTNYPSWFFYMGADRIEAFKKANVPLPEGYHFDRVDPNWDMDAILSTWRFVGEGEPEFTRARIRNLPSVCARAKNGDAAAFVMADHYGPPVHLYTLKGHRNFGLANAVQTQMGKLMIEFGVTPFKYVETCNTKVLEASFKSKFMLPLRIVTWHELQPIVRDSKL